VSITRAELAKAIASPAMTDWWRLLGAAALGAPEGNYVAPSVAADIAASLFRVILPTCRHHPSGCPPEPEIDPRKSY
jgi:hypothetical protein